MNWYYAEGGQQRGPVSDEELGQLASTGKLTDASLVWHEGMANWQPWGEVKPAVVAQPGTGTNVICSRCGGSFSPDDIIRYGEQSVCAACKPAFVQGLKEGVPLQTSMDYAGFWVRFLAKIVDSLILGCVVGVFIGIPFGIMVARGGKIDAQPGIMFQLVVNLVSYGLWGAYSIFFVGKYGATPGKMACKLKIVNSDGTPLSYAKATGRFFAEILSGLICYIGYFIVGFDDEKRSLHDRICDTRVVRTQPQA